MCECSVYNKGEKIRTLEERKERKTMVNSIRACEEGVEDER